MPLMYKHSATLQLSTDMKEPNFLQPKEPYFLLAENQACPPISIMLKTSLGLSNGFKECCIILTRIVKIKLFKMENLGDTIRKLREDKELPLRTVSAYLDIDQAILSKIERGQRKATRVQVVKLARYFKAKENDLLVAWLSDKLVNEVANESVALEALKVAEKKVKYISK